MPSLHVVRNLADVGLRLKGLRLQQNRTQDEVCAAVGLSRRALSALESGSAPDVRLQTVFKLLRYFKCQLMVGPESPVPTLDELDFERQHRARWTALSAPDDAVPRERATGQRRSSSASASDKRKRAGSSRPRRTEE